MKVPPSKRFFEHFDGRLLRLVHGTKKERHPPRRIRGGLGRALASTIEFLFCGRCSPDHPPVAAINKEIELREKSEVRCAPSMTEIPFSHSGNQKLIFSCRRNIEGEGAAFRGLRKSFQEYFERFINFLSSKRGTQAARKVRSARSSLRGLMPLISRWS